MDGTAMTRRWWIAGLLGIVIAAALAAVFYFYSYECIHACIYHRPLRYDVPFHRDVTDVDRIVVYWSSGIGTRAGSCPSLFEVTDPAEIADVLAHLQFEPRTTDDSCGESCVCLGGTGIDFYRGDTRIAETVLKHAHSLRWEGFSTMRVFGIRISYGDGPLTEESREWINAWLRTYGVEDEGWGKEIKDVEKGNEDGGLLI